MLRLLKKLLITYHIHEIQSLEKRQDTILNICKISSEKLDEYERKIFFDESLLMIVGLGRKISKHQNRIERLETAA